MTGSYPEQRGSLPLVRETSSGGALRCMRPSVVASREPLRHGGRSPNLVAGPIDSRSAHQSMAAAVHSGGFPRRWLTTNRPRVSGNSRGRQGPLTSGGEDWSAWWRRPELFPAGRRRPLSGEHDTNHHRRRPLAVTRLLPRSRPPAPRLSPLGRRPAALQGAGGATGP